jgi:hypothetical protein
LTAYRQQVGNQGDPHFKGSGFDFG